MRPRPDHPEWDTAIWLNVLGVPGTPGMFAFYREMEQWMRGHYNNNDATFRPEWSKGWAFGPDKPYTDAQIIDNDLPRPTATASPPATTGIPRMPPSMHWIRTRSSAIPSSNSYFRNSRPVLPGTFTYESAGLYCRLQSFHFINGCAPITVDSGNCDIPFRLKTRRDRPL